MGRRFRDKKVEGDGKVREYVLDTSVIIKWFTAYKEDDIEKALSLRYAMLNRECAVVVPVLMLYELANALRYNPHFALNDIKEALNAVIDMGFDVRTVEAETMESAIEIAFQYNVTVYDAYFMALSKIGKKPFVTADYKFYEKVKRFKNIIRLSEI